MVRIMLAVGVDTKYAQSAISFNAKRLLVTVAGCRLIRK